MGSRTTGAVGRRAEQLASDFLRKHKLQPLARNFYSRGGEIDLIMLDDDCLTFIEVRYRASAALMSAIDTIDCHKQRRIIRTAAMFVARNRRFANHTMRFDVIAIEGATSESINWIKDAFRPNNSTL